MEADTDADAEPEAELRAFEVRRMVWSSGEPQAPLKLVGQILIPAKLAKSSMAKGSR